MNERRSLMLAALVTGASVPGFAVVFALWARAGFPSEASFDPVAIHAFAAVHPVLYGALPTLGVLMHLAALVLVVGLHPHLRAMDPLAAAAGTVMGLSWVVVDTLQNLIHYGIHLGATPDEVVPAAAAVADALWHAGHLGGGVWVLTIAALGGALFSRSHRALSVVCGLAFALHPFVVPVWPAWFNLEFILVPVWALWTALAIRRGPAFSTVEATVVPVAA